MALPTPYYSRDGITLYHADCRDVLPALEPGSVDLVLTDPPYGCGKAEWDSSFPTEWYALAKLVSPMVCIITGSAGVREAILCVGGEFIDVLSFRNMNGITRSPTGFGNWLAVTVSGKKPRQGWNATEFVIRESMPDHPSPKPISFMRKAVERLSDLGQIILDPFAGSGTTLVAAKLLGRRAIGIEIEEKYCKIAVERLRQGVLNFDGG